MTSNNSPRPLDYPLVDIPRIDQNSGAPVVALDLDGVLNRLGGREELPATARLVEVCLPTWGAARAAWLVGHGRQNLAAQVVLDSRHGAWVSSLLTRGVEVAWCTSWETLAPLVYGPLLGVPPLPVVVLPDKFRSGPEAKGAQLTALFPQRSLVWLDDEASHRHLARHPAWPTLVPQIAGYEGLTPDVMEEVDAWLDANPEGCPRRTRYLSHVDNGEWRITTVEGSLRLIDGPRFRAAVFGRKLRQATGLPASLEAWPAADIEVGQRFVLSVSGQPGREFAEVTRIEFLRYYDPSEIRTGWPIAYPDLSLRRASQEVLDAELARHPGTGELAVRDGELVSFEADGTLLELDLTGEVAVLRAYVRDEPEGRGRWVDVAFERPWRLMEAHARAAQPRTKSEAVGWMRAQWEHLNGDEMSGVRRMLRGMTSTVYTLSSLYELDQAEETGAARNAARSAARGREGLTLLAEFERSISAMRRKR